MCSGTPHKVAVYFNLHKKVFSVKALSGESKGLVVAHSEFVKLKNCTFKVNEAGRKRVLAEKRKNVHAFVIGELVSLETGDEIQVGCNAVTYNPYMYSTFVQCIDDVPVHSAATVTMWVEDKKGIIYCLP